MSFQDVGRGNSRRQPANATFGQVTSSRPTNSASSSSSSPTSGGWGGGNAVSQISEALTQYQRNVGILEKIAQQMLATPGNSGSREELEQQYKVQVDVLRQLEQRVREQIMAQRRSSAASSSEHHKQALIKLERDFERVQGLANAAKARVNRQQKQLQQRGASAVATAALEQNSVAQTFQQEQKLMQMQLQQDKLHEEIMREREEEIRNINKGMHTVNEIYKDLAHIVGSQQDHVDQIENQMEDARNNAQNGLAQVQKANDRYNNSNCTIS